MPRYNVITSTAAGMNRSRRSIDQVRIALEQLPPPAQRLAAVEVCRAAIGVAPEDWEERVRGQTDTLSRPMEVQPALHSKYAVSIVDREDFCLDSLHLRGGRNGLLLHRCRRFRISNVEAYDLEGYGIILFDCSEFIVESVRTERLLASAIMCLGDTRRGYIRNVEVKNGRGFFNCDAGLHFNHCTPHIEAEHVPEQCHEARSISEKTKRPTQILVEDVRVEGCRAQGIYLEGAIACTIRRAALLRNNKEGICFDWGTSLCTLEASELRENGRRSRLSPEETEADFLHDYPVLDDGSSSCKLSAVSFDNAAGSIVRRCIVEGNFGGAFKVVRASAAIFILDNFVSGNEQDNAHRRFSWLFIADLMDVNSEFKTRPGLLDLGPSYGVKAQGNVIDHAAVSAREVLLSVRDAVRRCRGHPIWNRHLAPWFGRSTPL